MSFPLYDENGYVNIKAIRQLDLPFNFIIGPRGTGKTYTGIKEFLDLEKPFLYMRRMQVQLDECSSSFGNPFKAINNDFRRAIEPTKVSKNSYGFYNTHIEEKEVKHKDGSIETTPVVKFDDEVCTGIALSTFANLRGFDGQSYDTLLFDEFIPQIEQRTFKNEDGAFLNAYETINRNREEKGRKPLQCFFLGNADRLDVPILNAFDCISIIERMIRNDQEVYISRERGIAIFLLSHSPVAARKANSALYKAISDKSSFYRMAIDNTFVDYSDSADIRSCPIKEFNCVAVVGRIAIYAHKTNNLVYVCQHISGSPAIYNDSSTDKDRFKRDFSFVMSAWFMRDVVYDSYDSKYQFESIYKRS